PRELDHPLVPELQRALALARDEIGVAERRVYFEPELRRLENARSETPLVALHQLRRRAERRQRHARHAVGVEVLRERHLDLRRQVVRQERRQAVTLRAATSTVRPLDLTVAVASHRHPLASFGALRRSTLNSLAGIVVS